MALWSTGPNPTLETNGLAYSIRNRNLWTRKCFIRKESSLGRRKQEGICCSSSSKAASMESQEDASAALSASVEEEGDHVMRFKMSDFKILDHVSVGLGGRV